MPSKVWGEITYPFPNFNWYTIEWIRHFIPLFIVDVYLSMLALKLIHVRKRGPNGQNWFEVFFFLFFLSIFELNQKIQVSSNKGVRHFIEYIKIFQQKSIIHIQKQKLSNLAPAACIQTGCPWNKKNIYFLGIQHWTPRLNGTLNQIRCERITLHQVRSGKCQTDSGFLITPATARQSPEPIFVHRSYVINLIPCTTYISFSFEKFVFCKYRVTQNLFFAP